MPGFIIRRLTTPTASELDLLGRIVELAGKDDPISTRACGDKPELIPEYYRALLRGAAVGGHLLVACHDYPHNIVGCVACFGPGKDVLADAEQRALGFDEFLTKLSPQTMQWWSEFLPRYSAVANAITGPGVKLASWVIHCLAVDPNFRGRGAGRALVESAECLAKKDRLPVIFETESERNIQLYQYWGYEILGQQALEMGEDNLVLTVFKKDFSKV